ncbi:MAG: GDSL-type esterase/lipase family protein [Fuerstiella sp.]
MHRILLILPLLISTTWAAPQKEGRWEKSVQQFERQMKDGDSKSGSVLFIGSSSIRKWDLPKWFPGHATINHGFGGSEVADSLQLFDRIVKPLQPSMILMYAGDNDIGKGKTAEIVHADFQSFAKRVRTDLAPGTKLAFIAIKPSIKRWSLSDEMARANALIAHDCAADDQLVYVDIWTPMLGQDGKPMADLFIKDGLHLSDKGYAMWTAVVAELLPPPTIVVDEALSGRSLLFYTDFEDQSINRFEPTDATAWKLSEQDGNHFISLTKKRSKYTPPVRSPYNRTLIKDLKVDSFVLDVRLQSTIPDYNHRDLCMFFGYQDDAHLYYVHLGKRTDDHANQIFIVNDEPRTKISTKTTAGIPWNDDWHHARIVRDAKTGSIQVFYDDMQTPVMTATDTTFGTGRIGVGSFDDTGNFDEIKVFGAKPGK